MCVWRFTGNGRTRLPAALRQIGAGRTPVTVRKRDAARGMTTFPRRRYSADNCTRDMPWFPETTFWKNDDGAGTTTGPCEVTIKNAWRNFWCRRRWAAARRARCAAGTGLLKRRQLATIAFAPLPAVCSIPAFSIWDYSLFSNIRALRITDTLQTPLPTETTFALPLLQHWCRCRTTRHCGSAAPPTSWRCVEDFYGGARQAAVPRCLRWHRWEQAEHWRQRVKNQNVPQTAGLHTTYHHGSSPRAAALRTPRRGRAERH